MIRHVIQRIRLARELLAEHDREQQEYLTRDFQTGLEHLARFAATHASRPTGEGAKRWREAVEARIAQYPE